MQIVLMWQIILLISFTNLICLFVCVLKIAQLTLCAHNVVPFHDFSCSHSKIQNMRLFSDCSLSWWLVCQVVVRHFGLLRGGTWFKKFENH